MINFFKIKYLNNKETIHNFFWRSLQIFGKQGITFLIFVLCAKLLTPYEFGVYNYVLAIIYFLIMISDFGISTATSKYVAEYNTIDKEKTKNILFNSGIIIFGITIIVSSLTLFFGSWYLQDKYIYALYLLPLVLLVPLTSLFDGIYRGLKKFRKIAIISISTGSISLFFIFILIIKYGLLGALISQNIFYLLLLLLLAINYSEYSFKIDKKIIKEVGRYSFLVSLSTLGYFLYTRVDIIVLGHFGFIEEIGYYEIINKVLQIIILPVIILATVVAPNTTKNFALNRFNYLKKKVIKESIFLFFAGLFVSVCLYYLFPFILQRFLPNYDLELFKQMLIIILILVPFRFFSTYLSVGYITPSGKVSILAKYLLMFGIINLLLDFVSISKFGFIGIIYVTFITQILFIFFKDFISFIPLLIKYGKIKQS